MAKSRAKTKRERRATTAAKKRVPADRGEGIARMEPMVIGEDSRWRTEMGELAVELTYQAADFKSSLPDGVRVALGALVRNMNCYYSNLIEGHDTHPIAIERALSEDYDNDAEKRNLQLEAKAHIAVQRWIDEGNLKARPTAEQSIKEIHKRFVECLPDALRWKKHPQTGEMLPILPGEYRADDVQVGRLIPVSPGAVPRFMARYELAYRNLGRAQTIIACAAAHHRLTWVHPFLDGNGRVARLVSHAMMLEALDTGGIWSIARGLARDVDTYKGLLAECDQAKRNDLDGRGTLSDEALANFTRFFLKTCIDQVAFMKNLMQPERLRARILAWADEEARLGSFPKSAALIMEAVLFRGELPRSDLTKVIGGSERTASRVAAQLNSFGVLTSASSRAPWRLALPATLAHRWFPGLYPVTHEQQR